MKQLICPYCTNDVHEDDSGCCGESSAHFEEVEVCVVCNDILEEDKSIDCVCFKCFYGGM